jgi:D-alanyl-lipoteichoic acid acyltransferase DltB (MBOAT superfamily)
MLFPTTDFALFFAIVFALHWALNRFRTTWKWFILAASYVFYGWWDPGVVWLLGLVSTLAWGAALWVERQQDDARRRRRTMVAVAALLLPLAWFKYYGFFALNVANAFDPSVQPLPLQVRRPTPSTRSWRQPLSTSAL